MFIIVDIILQCRNCFPKISCLNWSVLHMVLNYSKNATIHHKMYFRES